MLIEKKTYKSTGEIRSIVKGEFFKNAKGEYMMWNLNTASNEKVEVFTELKEIVEWSPVVGEKYFSINTVSIENPIVSFIWSNNEYDKINLNRWNCFPTKAMAIEKAKKLLEILKNSEEEEEKND